jgi:hypothetical protein
MNRIVGWGSILMGTVTSMVGFGEIFLRSFFPGGSSTRFLKFLVAVFGNSAPYVSGALWLLIGSAFVLFGVMELRRDPEGSSKA